MWKFLWNILTGKTRDAVPGNSEYDPNGYNAQYASQLTGATPVATDDPRIVPNSPSKDAMTAAREHGYSGPGASGGLLSFLGSFSGLVPALVNRISAEHLTGAEREANIFSAEQAQIDRDFQERMANTQYQRGVADMRAAGVNPALAIGQGGAAAPSGQSAASVNPQGSAFNLGDIFQLMMMKPQVELMRSQGRAAVTNAEANRISAEAHAKDADTRRLEYENVNQPLALNRIKVGDSVVSLNEAQAKKVSHEIALLNEDITLAKLQQMATSLEIAWKGETWEDSRKLLAANIAKATAEKVYTYALAGKTSAEKIKILQENAWEKIYYDYWSNPANSDRGVNLEMLKGSNLTGAGIAYLQALGDNLQNREPGRQEQKPPYEHDGLGR